MIIADGGHLVHMLLHGKFTVQMEAEIADDRGRLDYGRTDRKNTGCKEYALEIDNSLCMRIFCNHKQFL